MNPKGPLKNLRALHRDTGGAVYVEFLVAFIPFFIMVLGMMQLALMYAANVIVHHAATTAARAAIVVMPDCDARYGGAPQNDINGGGMGDDPASALGALFGGGGGGGGFGFPGASGGGARLNAVRFAAGFPLVATSPSLQELSHDGDPRSQSLIDAIGGTSSPAVRLALGALGYNNVALAVSFVPSSGSTSYLSRVGNRDDITVRVTYLFHCGVPIVSKMACDDALQLFSGLPARQLRDAAREVSSGRGSITDIRTSLDTVQAARERLGNARPGLNDLQNSATGYSLSGVLLALTGGNFSVLHAEATLPNQGVGRAIAGECFDAARAR